MSKSSRRSLLLPSTFSLAACSGGGGLPIYTVGGTVQGLSGSGLVLQLNGENDLAISSDGAFSFPNKLVGDAGYEVTVLNG